VREDLQDALFAAYPAIFRQRDLPLTESAMARGFECAGGRFPILDGLCEVLAAHAVQAGHPPVEATQVKEKLGGLRFYSRGDCEFCRAAKEFACALSYHICEVTGRPGVMMIRGRRLRTLAEDFGVADGYERAVMPDCTAAEVTVVIEENFPPGWRGIASALKEMCRTAEREEPVRVADEDGMLSAYMAGNVDQGLLGALACARAMAGRTDRITGVMEGPTGGDGREDVALGD
jgi:hypothetical protein